MCGAPEKIQTGFFFFSFSSGLLLIALKIEEEVGEENNPKLSSDQDEML